ncbi:MAG: putative protease, partial [Crocinitomicaceae bacterium]
LLERSGVDAIIVQDLGLAMLCRKVSPSIEIHASTQMTITSPEGLEFIDSLYQLDRAVLSRELSIAEINKFNPTECVPLEVFVHGALCVAYSGQCLTSESLGQRSANRGECAQACRMPYELVVDGETMDMGEKRYLLSPQDLAAVDLIPDLVNQGVVSYKIEGRLKTPEYVAAVTRVYRKAIDDAVAQRESTVTDHEKYAMEMTFSRGFSTGWLAGTNHPYLTHGKFGKKRGVRVGTVENCGPGWIVLNQEGPVGVKAGDGIVFDAGENRDLEQGARVWKVEGTVLSFHHKHSSINWDRIKPGIEIYKTDDPKLNSEVKALWTKAKLNPIKDGLEITVSGAVGSPLTLECNQLTVSTSEVLQVAENRPLTTESLTAQLGRLGNTDYSLASIENNLDEGLIIPVSALNRARRALIEKLDLQLAEKPAAVITASKLTLADIMPTVSDTEPAPAELSTLTRHPHQIEAALESGIKRIYADFEDIRRYKEAVEIVRAAGGDATIHLATPRIQKPQETGYFKLIDKNKPDGVLIRNLGAVSYFADHDGLYRTGDFSLNCANPATAKILKERASLDHLTLSYDLNVQQLIDMLEKAPSDWFELTIHQHMPMFHMEHCVFCTFMSEGTSYKDCGRPCEKHKVQLRDRVGQLHTLAADVGCRNTLFNGRAQTGARFYDEVRATGLSRYRIDFLDEDKNSTLMTLQAYQQLIDNRTDGHMLWQDLGIMEKLGVTEGTLEVKS